MAELILPGDKVLPVAAALERVLAVTPPPTPKGRYALAKGADALAGPAKRFATEDLRLLTEYAARNPDGTAAVVAQGDGTVRATLDPARRAEFEAARADLYSEPVVLTGVRAITHAELGACPITGADERTLLGLFLEDQEPE